MSTHLALVIVRATGTSVQFGGVSFFAPASERANGIAADAIAAHVLFVALVDI